MFKGSNVREEIDIEKRIALAKYTSARYLFLLFIGLGVINTVLLLTGGDDRFVFSLFTPYLSALLGIIFSGRYKEMIKDAEEIPGIPEIGSAYYVGIALAVIFVIAFAALFILSKKKPALIRVALLMTFADALIELAFTVFLGNYQLLFDIIFHGWIIWELFNALKNSPMAFACIEEKNKYSEGLLEDMDDKKSEESEETEDEYAPEDINTDKEDN